MEPMIMGLEQSKALLIQMGERCLKLADDLGHGGRRLDKEQNDLLRTAYLPVVNEHLNLIKCGYIAGDMELITHSQDVIFDIIKGTEYHPVDKNRKSSHKS